MVLDYYELREQPFGVTPDARYLFLSNTHREALASLHYGIDAGCGFLALIAAPGLGKTTLLFHLLNQLRERALTIFLSQTVCTPIDLLRVLLDHLGVQDAQASLIQMQSRLKDVLLEQSRLGKRVVLVIDEAQNLDGSVLEQVRMLSNFETAREKLIQIILSGQPGLADKMALPELQQLRQRISIFSHLKPLSREDTELYIKHRLQTAGHSLAIPIFTRDSLALIAESSDGNPRNINTLCLNSLALGCAWQRKPIDRHVVLDVIDDLDLERCRNRPAPPGRLPQSFAASGRSVFTGWMPKLAFSLVVLVVLLVLAGALFFAGRRWPNQPGTAVHAESVVPVRAAVSPPLNVNASPVQEAGELPRTAVAVTPALTFRENSADTVSVMPGQTLFEICAASFGSCNPDLLRRIVSLNPGLSDPDHVEAGQRIRLPAANHP